MKRKSVLLLLIGMVGCFVAQCYAQELSDAGSSFDHLSGLFSQATGFGDASIGHLGTLFGSVGGLFLFGSGALIETLITVLNFGLVLFIGGLIAYSTSMFVVKSANEGSVMGQQTGAAATTIRMGAAVSFAVPLPHFGGYNFIQVFVLHLVVQESVLLIMPGIIFQIELMR